jgi:cytochrome c-type biogenesis protein CcsB
MAGLEIFSLIASLVCIAISIIVSIFGFARRGRYTITINDKKDNNNSKSFSIPDIAGTVFSALSLFFITLTIIARGVQTGHGPFSNMYEFAIAFSWGIIAMGLFFQWRYKTGAVKNVGLLVALSLIIFAIVQHAKPEPLVPALQQSVLLSCHVASAIVAYGTFTIGFGAAVLFLIQNRRKSKWLPSAELLDTMSYHSVVIGFPFLTALIILGALWADIAWGSYWSWDPKETASLVTWLVFAAYLHARVIRGWKGNKTALLIIVGFAAILLTFFGNYIFTGLHSYR